MTRSLTTIRRLALDGGSALALVLAGGLSAPAWAQAQGNEDNDQSLVLEEIIVTAQKRVQNVRDVPSSVGTLSGEKLAVISSGGTDIRFLAARVPSLNIESSFGRTFPRFYIRGLGNTDFDLNASQPVSLIYDEVVMENPILKGMPAFDLDRIEVLRGPQGTLFGRNTPAGIVKLESKKPTQEFDAYGRFTYGRFDTIEFEGAVGGPIVDDVLAARFSIQHQHRGNFIDNTAPGIKAENKRLGEFDDFAGRFQLLFTPDDRFTALLNVHARSLDGTARVFRANIIKPGTNDLVDGFSRKVVQQDGMNEQDLDQRGVTLKMDYDAGPVTLTSVTSFEHGNVFSRGDIDGGFGAVFAPPSGPGFIPFTSETADSVPDLDQWTQEVRIASNELGRVDFQAGFFFFNEDLRIESFSFNTLGGGTIDGFAKQRQQATSWALFGTVDVELTPDLVFVGGIRFSSDDKDFVAQRDLSPLAFLGVGPLPPTEAHPSDDVVSWDASLRYDLNDDVTLYTRVAKGFRAPSIQGRVLFGDEVTVAGTETILSFEGGLKAELLDRRARVNLSAYVYDMDNQQLTAVGGAANFNRLINARDTNGSGFEFDGEWAVSSHLLLTAGVSYNFTKLNDPDLRTQVCAACTVTDPLVGGLAQLDGNRLPQAPRWIANWTARLSQPVSSDSEIYLYTDWAYNSDRNFFLYESLEFHSGSELIGGLRLGYLVADGKYDFAVFGRNVTDQTKLKGGIDFNNLTGFVNEPPLWGFEVKARF